MRARTLAVGVCVALGLVLIGATGATTGSLPGGTSISVDIIGPPDGSTVPLLPTLPVGGTASVGVAPPVANTLLLYVIDVSGSTQTPQATTACGNQNVYDNATNRTLDCELLAIKDLNSAAATAGTVGQAGVIGFGGNVGAGSLNDAQILDLATFAGDQKLIQPGSNVATLPGVPPSLGVPAPHNDVDRALISAWVNSSGISTIAPAGWFSAFPNNAGFSLYTVKSMNTNTNYWAAVEKIKDLAAQSTLPNKIAVMVSDGDSTVGGPAGEHVSSALADLAAAGGGVKILTYAIGADADCIPPAGVTNYGSLEEIAQATGGPSNHCHQITNPGDIISALPAVIQSQLTSVSTSLDGGAFTPASPSLPLPRPGATTVNWTTNLTGLTAGTHHLCARATGSDGGGSGSVDECVDFTVKAPPTVTLTGGDDPSTGIAGTVPEGSPFAVGASVSDGTITWTSSGGTGHCTFADPTAANTSVTCDDNGTYALTISASDGVNPPVRATEHLAVTNVDPSASLTVTPASVPLGAPVTADVAITDPGTNDTFACLFDFGDGSAPVGVPATGSTCSAAHAYSAGGIFHVTVVVADDDGGTAHAAQDVEAKAPPQITLGGGGDGPNGYAGEVPEGSPFALTATIDGATSFDWGTPAPNCTIDNRSANPTFITCDDNGLYPITLTAVDEFHQVTVVTEHVLVDNVAPTVTGHDDLGPNPQNAVLTVHWTIADPGNDTFACAIAWGDGTTGVGTVSGNDCSGTHAYLAGGTFHPIATVTDDDGGVGSGGATVVLDAAPTVNVTDSRGNEGAIVFVAGVVNDDHGATAHWSVLPGADVDAGASCIFGDEFSPITTISCTDDGHYTLTMTANDGINPPVVAFGTLTLANVAPTLSLTSSVAGGLTVTVNGSVGDAGTNDTQTCSFTWNDGATTSAAVSGGTCSSSHTYAPGPATRTIDVTATDDDGGATTKSITVTLNRPPVCAGASASPDTLWPPDHRYVLVTIHGCTDADGDGIAIHVDSVTQDEALNGPADGDTSPDARREAGNGQVSLRAERQGTGDGRVYTIAFTASDGRGGTTTGTVTVGVPRNEGGTAVKTPGVSVNSFG
jgi:hypothetical protein